MPSPLIYEGPDGKAAYPYAAADGAQGPRRALRQTMRHVPKGAHIFATINLRPYHCYEDPLAQSGWVGIKWRAARA